MIHSTIIDVSKKLKISYSTIETAINNKIGTQVNWSEHTDLMTIGIDEISNRKGHQDYLTIVSVKKVLAWFLRVTVIDKVFINTIGYSL